MKGFTAGFTGKSQGAPGGMPGKSSGKTATNGAQHAKRKFVPIRKLGSTVTAKGKPFAGAAAVASKTSKTGVAKNKNKPALGAKNGGAKKKARQSGGNMKGASATPGPFQGFGQSANNSDGGYGGLNSGGYGF